MALIMKLIAPVLSLFLKCWATILGVLCPDKNIPESPEIVLRYLFSDKRLEILEFLADTYFQFKLFKYEGKIYVLDPKVTMKIINRLDKGAHDYLTTSPLNSSFLGATSRSPDTRHVISSIFRRANMEQNGRLMIDVIEKAVRKMKTMETVNVNDLILKVAMDVLGRVLFGIDLGALDGNQNELLEAMMTILHKSYALGNVKTESFEFQCASEVLDTRTREIFRDALIKTGDEKSLAQLLHEAGGFEEAVDNMKLFLMAGSETTASSIPVLMYLIASSSELQRDLQEEADQYINKVRQDGGCSPPKLESVTKELLRTFAIAPYISRQTQDALDLGFVTIPAESDLRIFTWGIHRSPQFWNNAKDFQPYRFLKENSMQHQTQKWIPFGAGSRICIGQHLAWVEMRLILTYFLHFFHFYRDRQTCDLDFCVDWEHAVVHPDHDVILAVIGR